MFRKAAAFRDSIIACAILTAWALSAHFLFRVSPAGFCCCVITITMSEVDTIGASLASALSAAAAASASGAESHAKSKMYASTTDAVRALDLAEVVISDCTTADSSVDAAIRPIVWLTSAQICRHVAAARESLQQLDPTASFAASALNSLMLASSAAAEAHLSTYHAKAAEALTAAERRTRDCFVWRIVRPGDPADRDAFLVSMGAAFGGPISLKLRAQILLAWKKAEEELTPCTTVPVARSDGTRPRASAKARGRSWGRQPQVASPASPGSVRRASSTAEDEPKWICSVCRQSFSQAQPKWISTI